MCNFCDPEHGTHVEDMASDREVGEFEMDMGILGTLSVALYIEKGQPLIEIFDEYDEGLKSKHFARFKFCPMCGRKL